MLNKCWLKILAKCALFSVSDTKDTEVDLESSCFTLQCINQRKMQEMGT